MKKILLLSFIPVPFLLSIYACNFFGGYSQSYVILINRVKVGKEVISEKTNFKGDLVCLSEQERDTYGSKKKERRIIRTKIVFPEAKLFPVSYSYESSAGTSYDVKVEDGTIIRTLKEDGNSRESITPLEPDMLMLDLNAFHTIDYCIRKYDIKKGRPQVFQTYLLPAGSVAELSVIPDQIVIPEHETKALQLRNYEIRIGNEMTIFVWVDKDNHLYRMFSPSPNIEVIRSDLFERLESKQKESEKK
ncbi:MAG: hypothetical protein JXR49_10030 [Acidobacteria bacterium]|nr:hypothetical protein [Acidobacteriota bacterium]